MKSLILSNRCLPRIIVRGIIIVNGFQRRIEASSIGGSEQVGGRGAEHARAGRFGEPLAHQWLVSLSPLAHQSRACEPFSIGESIAFTIGPLKGSQAIQHW